MSGVRASPAVVAAGLTAVLSGALGACLVGALLVRLASSPLADRIHVPPSLRPFVYGIWGFFFLAALFVAVAGVGVLRLRRWARMALLVVAAFLLLFAAMGMVVILFTLFVAPPDPAVSRGTLAAVLAFIYGLPLLVAIWWLALFTRRAVRMQFENEVPALSATGASRSVFNNPSCPLPVRIVGWYLASFLLALPLVPFFPVLPAFYFGHVFRGPAATLLQLLHLAVLAVPGLGLLLLKRWSYPAVCASQLLLCANAVYGAFSGSFESVLRGSLGEMALPANSLLPYLRYFQILGLVVPGAILATLLFCRRLFYAAAASPPPVA